MGRNYWVVSPNVKNNKEEEQWKDFICDYGYACIGYGEDHPLGAKFVSEVQIGDCVLVAQGANRNKRLYIAGIVKTEANWEDWDPMPSEACIRKLEPWIDDTALNKLRIEFNEDATFGSANQIKAIYQLHHDNPVDKAIIEKLEKVLKEMEMQKTLQVCTDLLQANKNLILTGAPGTGKTYLAKQIAQQMLFGKTKDEEKLDDAQKAFFKEHCGFVQFHPSYDYTDFVEGLRPTPPSDNGQIGFELKKGVFKEFCERALKAATVSGVDNFDEAWKKLTDTIVNEDEISIPLNSTKKTRYGISGAVSLRFLDISAGTLTKDNIYNVYRGLKGRDSGAYQNYMQAVVDYMKKNCGLDDYSPGEISSSESQKYIFVIDEINRGEISKIFGELFFSIDPGYRGEKGKVKTQYANLIPDGDIFYDGFFIPQNVYIIGTMNDIDRSVESFDFAMRRRFVWQEITAEQSADNMNLPASSNERMKHLNEAISKTEDLNAAYHIGGAYFLKLEKCNGDYTKLWTHYIEPLLKEYLRGQPNAKDDLKSLENAYNLEDNG